MIRLFHLVPLGITFLTMLSFVNADNPCALAWRPYSTYPSTDKTNLGFYDHDQLGGLTPNRQD